MLRDALTERGVVRVNAPEMLWAQHPGDGLCHAIAPCDLANSATLGYAEAPCGAHLPDAWLESIDRPWGLLCVPCVIGATADLPNL